VNTYKVTYVAEDATQTIQQTMSIDSVLANDYEVGKDFVTFTGDDHQVVAAYAVGRVVSITTEATTSGA
jgi:hypothetical protein